MSDLLVIGKKTDEEKAYKEALDFFQEAEKSEKQLRDSFMDNANFAVGDQWTPTARSVRESQGLPIITADVTHTYIASVVNQSRQSKPQAKVSPVSGGANVDVAEVLTGISRHIDYISNADEAADTALGNSTECGWGYIGLKTGWASPGSWDQEIYVRSFDDPLMVYGVLVPYCFGQMPERAFVVTMVDKTKYKREYRPDLEMPNNFKGGEFAEGYTGGWYTDDEARVAEYYYKKWERVKLFEVEENGGLHGITEEELDAMMAAGQSPNLVMDVNNQPKFRWERRAKVCIAMMDGLGFIRDEDGEYETEWVTDEIPIVPCLGQKKIVNGKIYLHSLITFIKDIQRLINLYQSSIAEKIGLAGKSPWRGPKGIFGPEGNRWETANIYRWPYLEYEIVHDENGNILPGPERNDGEAQISALMAALDREIERLKAGMGIFDAALGAQSNETSGRAIQARKQQAGLTNYHFQDNQTRCLDAIEKMKVKAIPKVYDRPGRQVRIIGEDRSQKVAIVNTPHIDPDTGEEKANMLNVGTYDVVVTVAPGYETARREAADGLERLFQIEPAAVNALGYIWASLQDFPGASECSEILKGIAERAGLLPNKEGQKQDPEVLLQQLNELNQKNQQLEGFAKSMHDQIEQKQVEAARDVDMERMKQDAETQRLKFKEEQATARVAMQEETKREALIGQIQTKDLDVALEEYKHTTTLEHEHALQDKEQFHDLNKAQMAHENSGEMMERQAEMAEAQPEEQTQ